MLLASVGLEVESAHHINQENFGLNTAAGAALHPRSEAMEWIGDDSREQ